MVWVPIMGESEPNGRRCYIEKMNKSGNDLRLPIDTLAVSDGSVAELVERHSTDSRQRDDQSKVGQVRQVTVEA